MQTDDRLKPEDLTDREAVAMAESLIRQVQRGTDDIFKQKQCKIVRARILELLDT